LETEREEKKGNITCKKSGGIIAEDNFTKNIPQKSKKSYRCPTTATVIALGGTFQEGGEGKEPLATLGKE